MPLRIDQPIAWTKWRSTGSIRVSMSGSRSIRSIDRSFVSVSSSRGLLTAHLPRRRARRASPAPPAGPSGTARRNLASPRSTGSPTPRFRPARIDLNRARNHPRGGPRNRPVTASFNRIRLVHETPAGHLRFVVMRRSNMTQSINTREGKASGISEIISRYR